MKEVLRISGYLRGEIAKMANVNIETLRYYENYSLIPSPIRSDSGYRLYSEEILSRLTFIKNAKFCGFSLKEIKKKILQIMEIIKSVLLILLLGSTRKWKKLFWMLRRKKKR
jgi:hypothetical protein